MAGGDWLQQGTVDASGFCLIIVTHQNASAIWEVEQVGISVGPKSVTANVVIYKNGNLIAPTSILQPQTDISGNRTSIGQTAAGLPYVYLQASDQMQVVVSSATAGDNVTVRSQIREYPLSDPNVRGR